MVKNMNKEEEIMLLNRVEKLEKQVSVLLYLNKNSFEFSVNGYTVSFM